MISNRKLLDGLFESRSIRIQRSPIFDTPPERLQPVDFGRIEGMMLGLAIGDALGNTSESLGPGERSRRYGEIRDYRAEDGRGYPSDDSQLAFWTLEQLIADDSFVPDHLLRRFTQDHIKGIGRTVDRALTVYRSGTPWDQCGQPSAANGALMRIAPILIPHLKSQTADLWADTALCTMITHNDSAAIASAVAFVAVVWRLLAMARPPAPEWWASTFIEIMKGLECTEYRPRNPLLAGFRGPLWKLIEQELPSAYARGLSVREACDGWYSGAYLLETVPCALYILMRAGSDPEEAIVRAVNDTRDNDRIAAIVGAAVGALHGRAGLPSRWSARLSGRTSAHDDGRMFQLLEQAKRVWG